MKHRLQPKFIGRYQISLREQVDLRQTFNHNMAEYDRSKKRGGRLWAKKWFGEGVGCAAVT